LTPSLLHLQSLEAPRPNIGTRQGDQAYTQWFEEARIRDEGRRERLLESQHQLPSLLWVLLILGAAVLVVYMLFFADSGERAIVQATMMGSVAVVISSTLLLLWFLDHPYSQGVGGLRPVAMQRTVEQLTHEQGIADGRFQIPCDPQGAAH